MPGGDPVVVVPGVPQLGILDVVGPAATSQRLGQLADLHHRYFPDYPHVRAEIRANASGVGPYPGCVVHQWLFLRAGHPVGLYLCDTNTVRGVVLRHFLAVDPQVRSCLPPHWLGPMTERIAQVGQADCAAAGGTLLATASEIHEGLFHLWALLGHRQLVEVPYAEPAHGMHWERHGREPRFLDITPNIRTTPTGAARPFPEVADAVLRAFLLDHYRLPPGHPRVRAILARAQELR